MSETPATPEGYKTINPFIITKNAQGLINFLERVFAAEELKDAHTVDDDGLILHSELKIGDSIVMVADRKEEWPFTPSLLQVYVTDLDATLATARELGANVVTVPTDFFGATLSRFVDPWNSLWWVYKHNDDGGVDWGTEETSDWSQETGDGDAEWSSESTPELTYIHDSLLTAMKGLADTPGPGAS